MKSRYIKILISVILIVSLCLAITLTPATAIETPIVIGGTAIALGGLAWAIANAMGVSFDLQNYTQQTVDSFINPYYQIQQTLTTSDFTFVKAFRLGYDALQLSLDAYNAIKSGAENIINSNNIPDNATGTIAPVTTDGYDTKLGLLFQTTVSHAIGATWTYNLGRYSFVLTDTNQYGYTTCKFYVNGTQYGQDAGYISTNAPQDLFFKLTANGNKAYLQVGKTAGAVTFQSTSFTIQQSSTQSLPYESQTVDTYFGDTALQNVSVIIPQQGSLTAASPLDDVLEAINELALDDNPDVTVEVDVAPAPTPTPIPTDALGDIPFNTFYDVYGGSVLEEIDRQTQVVDTLGQSIWDQLTRIEEKQELMVLNGDSQLEDLDDIKVADENIASDVDDLVGLQTDINENLEDVITYEQSIEEEVTDISTDVANVKDEVIVIVDEMGNVIDVLEGIDAKAYAQGQKLGEISTEVGTVADTAEALQTEVEAQSETLEETKEAVQDLVPYVVPLPDIATDTETMVDILPDIKTATQTQTETLTDTLPDIKDATQTITDTLPDIITKIDDATTTLTDDIPNIDDICENIDEAPYKDLDNGLDRLPRFLLPFITDLRSALGIWHYVTEWLAQISTTLAFISGCLVGTSIMTPIYAAIAGFMCIKIYRRMTA